MAAPVHRQELQGVRAVAITGVVGFHALRLVLTRHGGNWGDVDVTWAWAGVARFSVDAFFVLAGFLVVASWRHCREGAVTTIGAAREFAARRAWRLLPPYLAMLVVLIPLVQPRLLAPHPAWGDLLRLVTVQQYLDADLPGRVNLPIWALTTEVHFYVVAPALVWLLARFGGWRLVLPAMALGVWWQSTSLRGDLAASLLPGRLSQFVAGAAAGALVLRWESGTPSRLVDRLRGRASLPVLVVALLALGAYHGATHQATGGSIFPNFVAPIAGVVLAALYVRLVCGPSVPVLLHPALHWLGGISFSLYLWHYPIMEHGLRLAPADLRSSPLVGFTMLVLVAVSVVVATAAHRIVEVPFRRLEDRRRDRKASREPSSRELPVVQAELRLEDLQEVPLAERDEARRSSRSGADERVTLP